MPTAGPDRDGFVGGPRRGPGPRPRAHVSAGRPAEDQRMTTDGGVWIIAGLEVTGVLALGLVLLVFCA